MAARRSRTSGKATTLARASEKRSIADCGVPATLPAIATRSDERRCGGQVSEPHAPRGGDAAALLEKTGRFGTTARPGVRTSGRLARLQLTPGRTALLHRADDSAHSINTVTVTVTATAL